MTLQTEIAKISLTREQKKFKRNDDIQRKSVFKIKRCVTSRTLGRNKKHQHLPLHNLMINQKFQSLNANKQRFTKKHKKLLNDKIICSKTKILNLEHKRQTKLKKEIETIKNKQFSEHQILDSLRDFLECNNANNSPHKIRFFKNTFGNHMQTIPDVDIDQDTFILKLFEMSN